MLFLIIILIFLASCTPKTQEIVYKKSNKVILKKGEFYLTEEEFKFVERKSKRFGIKVPKRKEIEEALRKYLSWKEGLEFAFLRMKIYEPLIVPILRKYNLPEEFKYLPVVESMYNPFAVSRSGAAGIWQLMPYTAKRYGLKINSYIDERFDILKSTEAASKYLKDLYKEFRDWEKVLAAYNCGEGCVKRNVKTSFWNSKNLLPEETRNYVPQFMALLLIAKNPEKYGIRLKEPKRKIFAVKTDRKLNIYEVMFIYDLEEYEFKDLNPHIKGSIIPEGSYIYISEEDGMLHFSGR